MVSNANFVHVVNYLICYSTVAKLRIIKQFSLFNIAAISLVVYYLGSSFGGELYLMDFVSDSYLHANSSPI